MNFTLHERQNSFSGAKDHELVHEYRSKTLLLAFYLTDATWLFFTLQAYYSHTHSLHFTPVHCSNTDFATVYKVACPRQHVTQTSQKKKNEKKKRKKIIATCLYGLSNVATRQTDKQTNATKNIIFLSEIISLS